MERDRGAALIIQSAAEGLIDYREARLLDPKWWRRLRLLLTALERKTRAKAIEAGLHYHLALVANGSLTEQSFEKVQQTAQERYFDLLGAYRPWEGKSYQDRKQNEFRSWRQAYIDNFGVDPLSPEFKAWEKDTVERLIAGEFDDNTPDPTVVVTERLRKKALEKPKPKRRGRRG